MIGLLHDVLVVAAFWITAAWAHELTHAATVRVLGGEIGGLHWRDLRVVYGFEDDAPRWKPRVVGWAPFLIGIAALLPLAALDSIPTTLAAGGAWVIYTIGGSLADYHLGAARGEGTRWSRLDQYERDIYLACSVCLAGVVVWVLVVFRVWKQLVLFYASIGLVVAGIGYLVGSLMVHDSSQVGNDGSSPSLEDGPGAEASYPARVGRDEPGDTPPDSTE